MKFNTFTLGNDLQVLAISDDRFIKSSAAMAVMAGSMQNPDEHLGLAHFLEHMLFLGTEEFPKVGDYEDFLNKNGGGHNAYTSIDHTNYFFDINHEAFDGALNRFSRFFVSPTFDQKYVDREKNAVHSEHEKNRKDDHRREYRVQQLISEQKHPFAKFATGDKDTLAKADRAAVMDFYKKSYSSNIMRLVLMSDQDPAKLELLAKKYFADVPNRKLERPDYSENLFPSSGLPRVAQVKSVRDQQLLKVSFDIPDELPYWKSKPAHLLAHLIGDEGEGSLLSHLKDKGLALGLSTSTWWRTFSIRVTLTEAGKKNPNDILRAIYSYVSLLKKEGLKKYTFEERKQLSAVELQNIEPKSSMSRASDFSSSMLYYSVDTFLQDHYLFHEYSPEDFNHFLSFLRVDNMQVTMFARDSKTNETEKYYGIEYGIKEMDSKIVSELKNIVADPALKVPGPNPFVPDDFSLVSSSKTHPPQREEYKSKAVIYSQVDTSLEIPKGSIALSFSSDIIKGDPKTYLTAQLYGIAKGQQLNEWGYPARLAGLNYNIGHGNNTITMEVSGYNQHLPRLLKKLILDEENNRRLDEVKLSADLFERIKKKYKRNLMNADFDAAYQKLLYENGHFFSTGSVHRDRYKDMVDQITLEDINSFAKKFFKKVAIRAYGYGNLNVSGIEDGIDHFLKNITSEVFSEKDVESFESKYVELPDESLLLTFKGQNNNNSQLSLYKASPWTVKDQAIVDVISKIIEQPFFTELRTQQQLGYVVAAFATSSNGFCGLGTLIQSQTTDPFATYEKADQFLMQLLTTVSQKVTDEEIAPIKAALINEISRKPNSLNERLARFTAMAGTYHGDFKIFDKLVKELEAIRAEDIRQYIKEHVLSSSGKKVLTFLYYGTDSKSEKIPSEFKKVDDIEAFKQKLPKIQPYRNSKSM